MLKSAMCGVLLVGWLAACNSGDGSAAAEGDTASPENSGSELRPEGTPARRVSGGDGVEVRYQFVDTANGMTIEAVSGDQVQTLSCPTRTCAGFCDECAARACEASGQLADVCRSLVSDCSNTCTCSSAEGSAQPSSCGFPVCAFDRNLCYIGSEEPPVSEPPSPAGPDPAPEAAPISAPSGAARPAG